MTASELEEWREYENLYPFSSEVEEVQRATTNFLISASNGGKMKFEDFMISGKNKKQTRKKMAGMAKQFMEKWEDV